MVKNSRKDIALVLRYGVESSPQALYCAGSESIYIKKKVCLFVCLFAMHSVPERVRAARLSKNHPLIQEKVIGGSTRPGGGWEIPPPLF